MNKHGEVTMPRSGRTASNGGSGRTASNGVQMSNLPKHASKKGKNHAVISNTAPPKMEAPAFMPREEVSSAQHDNLLKGENPL